MTASPQILLEKDLQDPRIHILQQKNKGGGAARNLGMSVATGDYLLFLDSDDFFEETFIEKMYNTAVETSADMVICQYREYNTLTETLSGTLGIDPRFISRKKVRIYDAIPVSEISFPSMTPWNKLCSRKFIQDNEIYFQEINHYNDNYFSIISALSAERIATIPDTLIYYRVGMKTNTQSTHYNHPYDLFEVMSAIYHYLITTHQFDKFEIAFYEFLIGGCSRHLKKLQKCDCHKEIYTHAIHTINRYNISKFSLRNCHNKLNYMRYLKLIEYPYSIYINEKKGDAVFFLFRHPVLVFSICFYLLQNTWWYLKAYGIHDVFYQVARITHITK